MSRDDETRRDPEPDDTQTHAGAPRPSPERMPASIGRYRVVGKLGEGGMGIVYEAEQENPRRRVAVKVVRVGRAVDEAYVRMFQREVDTLARLDHPNIGAIYESGCTPDGRQFFAMELIRGKTLDAYLRDRAQRVDGGELRFRLALFQRIAEAVHYAHQRGVIHRDLKPSNIVVVDSAAGEPVSGASLSGLAGTRLPTVKILDFGLARITEGDLAQVTTATEIGVIKGTLAYMSPEQAAGDPDAIDVRADVYALGVILYEMLAGVRPYDVARRALAEAVRIVREERPRPLRVAAPDLARIDADVETIVGKALEKEADRRYAGAAELAADVGRYLTSQPILARPPSAIYQLKKLVARNRVPAALVGVLLLAVIGFGIGMSVLYARATRAEVRAQQQAETATRALDFMTGVFEVSDPSEALGAVITAREVLDRGAERIDRELADQPETRATLMTAIGRVYGNLGLNGAGEPLLERALAGRREALGPADPRTLETAQALGQVYVERGRFRDAVALLEEALGPFAGAEGDRRVAAASAEITLADAYRELGDADGAEPRYLSALADLRALRGGTDADTLSAMNNLAILYTDLGRFDEAAALASESLALQESKSGADHPETIANKSNLARIYLEQGRLDEAEALLRGAVDSAERVNGPDHPDTQVARANLALFLLRSGRMSESEELYERTLEIQVRTLGPDHPSTLMTRNNLVVVLQQQERYDEALDLARGVVDGYTRILGPEHPQTLMAANNLATHYLHTGDYAEAERRLRELRDARIRVQGRDHPDTAIAIENHGNALYNLGRHDETVAALREVLDIRTRALGEDHAATSRTRHNLAVVLGSQGRRAEAEEILRREIDVQIAAVGPDHPDVANVLESLSEQQIAQGKLDEAIVSLGEAVRVRRAAFGERDPIVAQTLQRLALAASKGERHDLAEEAIAEAIAIRREALGEDDPQTLVARYWQVTIVGKAGRTADALALAAACHEDCVRTNLTEFPLARRSAELAAEFAERLGDPTAAEEWRRKSGGS